MILVEKEKYLKEELVLIECDFKYSPKCKQQYVKIYKNILLCRKNNNGKDRCVYCFNSMTKLGEDNFNFKIKKNEDFFKDIDCELKVYMLGWVAGDGHLAKDGLFFEIHEKDIEILELFQSHISPDCPIYKRKDERGINTLSWRVHSVTIVNDLVRALQLDAFGPKHDKISIPKYLSIELTWAFIRGLFDSDGWISDPLKGTYPKQNICSTSHLMIDDLSIFLTSQSIGHSNHYPIITSTGRKCMDFLSKIYEDASFYLSRKHDCWQVWKTWIPLYGTSVKSRKIRTYYPAISESQKKKIIESNKKRKGIKYVRN